MVQPFAVVALVVIAFTTLACAKTPIVVMNGVGGTVVYATLNKPSSQYFYCDLKSDWYRIWINLEELAPLVIDCTCENLGMTYDPSTRQYFNYPGVTINATSDFGGFDAMNYLDPDVLHLEPYMANLTTYFLALGYQTHKDLLGAPYDWRLAADGQRAYLLSVQNLIETAVTTNNAPAVLVGHSMGGLMSLKFLQMMTPQWKKTYIKAYVPVDAPWGGAVNALMGIISGYNLGESEFPHDWFRNLQINTPSMGWFLPIPGSGTDGTFGPDTVLVTTPTRTYTAFDFPRLIADEGLTNFGNMYNATAPLLIGSGFGAPGVDTYIVYGYNLTTTCGLLYSQDFSPASEPPAPTSMFNQCDPNGDGTVNINSLQRGERVWATDPAQSGFRLSVARFPNVEHMDAIGDTNVLNLIASIASS